MAFASLRLRVTFILPFAIVKSVVMYRLNFDQLSQSIFSRSRTTVPDESHSTRRTEAF